MSSIDGIQGAKAERTNKAPQTPEEWEQQASSFDRKCVAFFTAHPFKKPSSGNERVRQSLLREATNLVAHAQTLSIREEDIREVRRLEAQLKAEPRTQRAA